MRKRQADDIAASGAVSTSGSPPTKRLRLDSTAVHQMIQRLDSHEITGESIRQVLTEIIETDNPDAKQTDPADLVKPKRPHYIMPLYNLDDPVDDRRLRHAFFTVRPIVPVLLKTHPAAAATIAMAAAAKADEDKEEIIFISILALYHCTI